MKKYVLFIVVFVLGMAIGNVKAQERALAFEAGGDVVSSYVWRGQDCGGLSIQPSATLTHDKTGLSFGVWASAELFENRTFANMAEFDLNMSWAYKGLVIGLTDYNFCAGNDYFRAWTFNGNSSHNLEANLCYDFGLLALSWNTCLTGADYNADGDRSYSTYIEASSPFELGGVNCTGTIGILPWEDGFISGGSNHGFNVVNLSLKAEKEIGKIPVFGQIVVNPQKESTYFVVGVSF